MPEAIRTAFIVHSRLGNFYRSAENGSMASTTFADALNIRMIFIRKDFLGRVRRHSH